MIKHQYTSSSTTNAVKCLAISLIVISQYISPSAQADQSGARNTIYFTLPPSPEVLASHLFGVEKTNPLTRSITFNSNTTSSPTETERSVTMPILFHFGSTTMTDESKPFLDNVGKMLVESENNFRNLVVEGHTDSVGSTQYNDILSEQRAKAIKEYLVSTFGVNPNRLRPVGKGENLLYNRINPESGENRRVEFLPFTKS